MLFRDLVPRITIRQLQAQHPPRIWRRLDAVELEAHGVAASVEIIHVPSPTAYGGTRRYLRCPRCRELTWALGLAPTGEAMAPTWSCARRGCGGWKSRKKIRLPRVAPPPRAAVGPSA